MDDSGQQKTLIVEKNLVEDLDLDQFFAVELCPICCSEITELVGNSRTIHPKSKYDFLIKKCLKCGHWFTDPTPEQNYLLKLYSDYSLSVYGEGWVNQITNKYLNHPNYQELFSNNWILKKECKTSKKGNYLEIGPGGGEILKCFESLGWNCYGVEPGRWVNGNPKILHNFSKLPTNILYDVIVAEDVIEHVTNPLKMISELSKKLSANGRIYFTFPNSESLRSKLRKTSWRMVRPIGHLHYFSFKSISIALYASNLKLCNKSNYDLLYSRKYLINEMKSNLFKLNVKIIFSLIANLVISLICMLFNSGDQWRITAVKR